ncbi:LamG domain-containing protein, partial [Verrucomicrobia bacterium]|nr:LamG domain-containing protein [Verrucomicrobiota bacterium]
MTKKTQMMLVFIFALLCNVNAQLRDGLVAYWPLDGISGETAPDVVGGYNMELTNMDDSNVVEGKVGNAFSFSNGDQTLLSRTHEEGDELPINKHESFTVSFWAKIQGNGQNDLRVFSESNTAGNNTPLFNLGTKNNGSDGTVDIYIRGIGPTVGHIFTEAEPFDDEWSHVVFVQEDLERKMYIDGELDSLEIAARAEGDWDLNATSIGGIIRGSASHWVTGAIDEVALWKRALSESEVSDLNANGVPQTLVPLIPDLIAYWPFDGDLSDKAGNNDGEAQGTDDISYDDGQFGQGIDLDGVDQFVQTPVENEEVFDFQDGTGFSISAWYRVDEFNKSWQALIAKGEGNRWRVHRRGGEAQLTGNGGSGDVPGATGDINDGEIHHLVLVSDPENDQVRFYSDGELVSEGGAPAIQSNDNPMMIGENPDARNRTWGGLIDDVGIWNRPITEDEIAYMYNEGEGRAIVSTLGIDLAGYWPMDEGSGNVAADTTGSNDAQLYNEVEWVDDGERGSVLSFNGADAYADAGAETIPQMTQENDFTWSMWAYDRAGGNNNVILGNRYGPEGGDFSPREFIKFTPRQFEFHYNGGGGGNVDFDDLQPDEGWFHHATVKSGNTLTYYRNGEAIDSREFDGELNNPQPLYFGGDKANENWNGMLDDVAIWTRALSAGEVKKIFG